MCLYCTLSVLKGQGQTKRRIQCKRIFCKGWRVISKHPIVRRTAMLTLSNGIVRFLGFVQRIWLSRMMGAAGLGLYQMVFPIGMAAMLLVASGLPVVASQRMAADLGKGGNGMDARIAAMRLAKNVGLLVSIALALFCVPIATGVLGQSEARFSLLAFAPCIVLQAVAAIELSWCHAHGNAKIPSITLLVEQISRLVLTIGLFIWLQPKLPQISAMLAIIGMTGGEALALGLLRGMVKRKIPSKNGKYSSSETLIIAKSAAWPTAGRVAATLMQAFIAAYVPSRLIAMGMTSQAALSWVGLWSGVAMPLLYLPLTLCSALGTILVPEIATQNAQQKPIGKLCRRATWAAVLSGIISTLIIFPLAPQAAALFGQPSATPLIRMAAPSIALLATMQVQSALLQGLARQRAALFCMLLGGITDVAVVLLFLGKTSHPLGGVFAAHYAGGIVTVAIQTLCIYRARKQKNCRVAAEITLDDKALCMADAP